MKPKLIAIDGPAGVGKSTLARGLAAALGFRYIDTGALFRAAAWWLLDQGLDLCREEPVLERLLQMNLQIYQDERQTMGIRINGRDATPWLRSEEVAQAASTLAVYPGVRRILVDLYRREGSSGNTVMEGRDIGTVAFPDACLKLFVTATEEARARRRYLEHRQNSSALEASQVEESLRQRDARDQQRKHAPLQPAEDAVLLDTTHLSVEEVFQKALSLAREKLCT